ncbi:KR domain-containing protein [Haloferax sp. MBLA0076]|uniref:KR domain-containing protein n=1 Tax=Haloferax litoreum TaxID=2666140 RepID=A0A6A8GKH9_9EURY|nr:MULTISPECIES: saccharopine dehydrogenase NADP-binding domain-containing protein [Haloferax]KAB1190388.1 KR domain-containing protein [Haloferax sp. CBA1148]MRX23359.1 KR domain-containing protein [Haloferax litoreum]
MTTSVLVVGGYGIVGRHVCRLLAENHDTRIVVAGRTREKASAFASTLDRAVSSVVDLRDSKTFSEALDDVDCAVVCVSPPDESFAQRCLESGVDYVDISPSDSHLRSIETLDDTATANETTAVLSVGLAPGVTNLLAESAMAELDTVDSIALTLVLGIGEHVGRDTFDWVADRLRDEFTVQIGGHERPVRPFSDPRMVSIPGIGRRRVYRYDVADQHVLARTTDAPTVGTWLCYDSTLATRLSAFAVRTGLVETAIDAVGREAVVDTLDAGTSAVPFGSDEFVVISSVSGRVNDGPATVRRWLRGRDQGRATAIVAAAITSLVLELNVPPGVYHSHEAFEGEQFERILREHGYAVGRETVSSST